jgi:hypothetical protein
VISKSGIRFPTSDEREYPVGWCRSYAQGLKQELQDKNFSSFAFLEIYSGLNAPLSVNVARTFGVEEPGPVVKLDNVGIKGEKQSLEDLAVSQHSSGPKTDVYQPALEQHTSVANLVLDPSSVKKAELVPVAEVDSNRAAMLESGRQPRWGKNNQLIADGMNDPYKHLATARLLKHPSDSLSALHEDHEDSVRCLSILGRDIVKERLHRLATLSYLASSPDFVKQKMEKGGTSAQGGTAMAHKPLPNFEKFGTVERQAQSRIGVLTADNMVYAFNAIPHAWISEKADITKLEKLRQENKDKVKAAGGALTTTAIIAKAVCSVLKKMPQFNASYDLEKREVIFKKYYNIGIAVDTPRGLIVPVLQHTDQKNLTEISVELSELSVRTRDGKNKPEDLDGGTFTISNIGGIGGTNMISIVNWPQVAILSITAAQMEPFWNGSAFEPRLMMPMTIGWDHRVINGADAARFLVELKKILEEPFLGWL